MNTQKPVTTYLALLIIFTIIFFCGKTHANTTSKKGDTSGTEFIFTYINPVEEAKGAFEYAASLWGQILKTDVPIHIQVTWRPLGEFEFAHAEAPVTINFDGATYPDTYYPFALAEKLAQKELNQSTSPDIIVEVNSDVDFFYYGIEGEPGEGQQDFITIIFHELAHGLGFYSSIYIEDGLGSWGSGTKYPFIFDRFIADGSMSQLIDTSVFKNHSSGLAQLITSNDLYFNGAAALKYNNNAPPRLFAPSNYVEGSSIYHLDESTYPAGNENALMTPLFTNEVIRSQGPLLKGIFADLGWTQTYIHHKLLNDSEDTNADLPVNATIIGDTSLIQSSVKLRYSYQGIDSAIELLPQNISGNEYSFLIPAPGEEDTLRYYILVENTLGMQYTFPYGGEDYHHTVILGQDNIAPHIQHQKIVSVKSSDTSIEVIAEVTDNIALDSVFVDYQVNDKPLQRIYATSTDGINYSSSLPVSDLQLGDVVNYRIGAVDKSSQSNQAILPKTDFYSITVTNAVSSYFNDFNAASNDFVGDGFEISTPNGFKTGALHTQHPYLGTGQNQVLANYTIELINPIVLKDRFAVMSFDEIVLVEPGDEGVKYGFIEFWDYVIVEAQKSGQQSWIALTDGYDSRLYDEWLKTYNSDLEGTGDNENSVAQGSESLYKYRFVSLYGPNNEFQGGDEIRIRFRLFSDPFRTGWGWAIDNLKIQYVESAIADIEDVKLTIWPNPAKDMLNINTSYTSQKIEVQVFDIYGKCALNRFKNNTYLLQLRIKDLPDGVYILQISDGTTHSTLKFVKTD